MKVDTFKCDVCEAQKRDANHWFKGYVFADKKGVAIVPWDVDDAYVPGCGTLSLGLDVADAHLCGADCVTQWLSKNLL